MNDTTRGENLFLLREKSEDLYQDFWAIIINYPHQLQKNSIGKYFVIQLIVHKKLWAVWVIERRNNNWGAY